MSKDQTEQVFHSVSQKLKQHGIQISGFMYCPHQTSDNCDCKKPKPQLLHLAAKASNIDLSQSYMIGDMDFDIQAGKNANMKTILVLTGLGEQHKHLVSPDHIINDVNGLKEIL